MVLNLNNWFEIYPYSLCLILKYSPRPFLFIQTFFSWLSLSFLSLRSIFYDIPLFSFNQPSHYFTPTFLSPCNRKYSLFCLSIQTVWNIRQVTLTWKSCRQLVLSYLIRTLNFHLISKTPIQNFELVSKIEDNINEWRKFKQSEQKAELQ